MTTRKNVAKWLLEEHRKVEKLAGKLRELTAEPSGSRQRWLDNLKKTFGQFHERLLKHFTLEEDGGYLEAVVERRPTLSNRVDELEHEHRQIKPILIGIEDRLERTGIDDGLLIDDALHRIRRLLEYIEQHEQRENDMVSATWSTDMGTAD